MKGATSGVEKIIGDSLRANPGNSFSTLIEAKQKLVNGSYALIYVRNWIVQTWPFFLTLQLIDQTFIHSQFNLFNYGLIDSTYRENNKQCRLTLGKTPYSMLSPVVYTLAKNGPYTKAINEQYLKFAIIIR